MTLLLYLRLELLSVDGGGRLGEAVDPGRDGALVGQVARDATLQDEIQSVT